MARRYEFTFHPTTLDELRAGVEPTLAMMGTQGWSIVAVTAFDAATALVTLQRELADDESLIDPGTLHAAMAAPLVAPTAEELETLPERDADG